MKATMNATMKAMTIRGVEPALADALKRAATAESRSVNQLILDTLRERFGLTKSPRFTRRHHDLDALFGSLTESDYTRLSASIDDQRTIDAELWR
jgi:hypothetical protein